MHKSVSLADVARRAGVSIGTVSHVLNGRASARIAPGTQERVRRLATEMGYRPNVFARSLLGKQTRTWGLVLGGLVNPFYVGIAKALQQAAAEADYRLVLSPTLYETRHQEDCPMSPTWPVDGVMVWGRTGQQLSEALGDQARTLPVVHLGYEGSDPVDCVSFDLSGGARLAMDHLNELGYRSLAYVLPDDPGNNRPTEPRSAAYETYCRDLGMAPDRVTVDSDTSACLAGLRAGIALARRCKRDRPEAIFCFNDALALGVYNGVRRAGLDVPGDIGIIGFDGVEDGQCLDRPLTTILTPARPLAAAAAHILSQRSAGDKETCPHRVVVPTTLLTGQTTRCIKR